MSDRQTAAFVVFIFVCIVAIFGMMFIDEQSRRNHELEMAKAGYVKVGKDWKRAEGKSE